MQNYGQNPGIYYYVNDHLGTPQQLITATGLVVWQAAYLPYGEAQVRIDLVENNLRFPGQYFDAESGLHYNWNRYYDAQTGRYISADPIGLEGGMNVYAYVGGNPVNYFDLFGLKVELCRRPADIMLGLVDHHWLKTDTKEAGMGGVGRAVPGDQFEPPYQEVMVRDHTGQSEHPDATCRVIPWADEDKVNELLTEGRRLGRWHLLNQCQSFAQETLRASDTRPEDFDLIFMGP